MEESRTAVVAALLGNASLALLKGIAAAVTGSAAMLAETFHSIADTGNQVLLLVGMRWARQPANATHPFGHGKNVYFWSFVVAMLLFTIGGAFSIWEAVRHWLHPGARTTPALWAYGVLAGSFVFESISLGVTVTWCSTSGPKLTAIPAEPKSFAHAGPLGRRRRVFVFGLAGGEFLSRFGMGHPTTRCHSPSTPRSTQWEHDAS